MDINELKKDFEDFGKGVKRLEQLEAEFNKIDTSSNKKEAGEIRHMLKNVSAIPELELRIAKLKGRYRGDALRYRFNRVLPAAIRSKDQNTGDIKGKIYNEVELLERKYKSLIEKNNNKILNEINSVRSSIKSLVNTLGTVKNQVWKQENKLKTQKAGYQYRKIPEKDSKKIARNDSGESRKFFKCQNLLLRAEIAIQNKDKLKARDLYFRLIDNYSKIEYSEQKKIYNKLMKLYNNLSKLDNS